MREEFLHYLFRTKQLGNEFMTTNGHELVIVDFGRYNTANGPDFLETKIKWMDKIWAGPIEFHVKSSDWFLHQHQTDDNYKNVVAHFVYEHNQEVMSGKHLLPTVELKELIPEKSYHTYQQFLASKNTIACQFELNEIDDFIWFQQKEKALIHRLQRKSNDLLKLINDTHGDIEKTWQIILFKAFGTKLNQSAFEDLAKKFPTHFVSKVNGNQHKIEALLFGLAGFLSAKIEDEYPNDLQKEFNYLQTLHQFQPMALTQWKFSPLRPPNFPTVKLAQLSAVLTSYIDSAFILHSSLKEIIIRLKKEPSIYWINHYHIDKPSKRKQNGLSDSFIDLLLINAILPFRFAMGLYKDNETEKRKVLDDLNEIKSEKNSIIQQWKQFGVKSENAFDSQALIEQKNEFCNKKQCLSCKIGQRILKSKH